MRLLCLTDPINLFFPINRFLPLGGLFMVNGSCLN